MGVDEPGANDHISRVNLLIGVGLFRSPDSMNLTVLNANVGSVPRIPRPIDDFSILDDDIENHLF